MPLTRLLPFAPAAVPASRLRRFFVAALFALPAFAAPFVASLCLLPNRALAAPEDFDLKEHYTKYEYRIPMRDGARLFTVVYAPKDQSKTYPFLMVRTPYGVGAYQDGAIRYGVDHYPPGGGHLGPSEDFDRAGYIFVFQDVRGRYLSEGHWLEMTPHRDEKKSPAEVDESSDMHDTVDWLLKNVPGHNGSVGIWGISYPGFYTSAGIIDSHPAIKAASPQAPVTDLYMGDDTYRGGAFMLSANFDFYTVFNLQKNPTPEPRKWDDYEYGTPDAYDFFLQHGTLAELPPLLRQEDTSLWKDQYQHDTYDAYWKARNIAAHLHNIHCAVLTVGGWFDAEDLQGPLTTYRAVGQNNPGIFNGLVMGPWVHGGWARFDGRRLGAVDFAADTAEYYRKNLVFPFFEHWLKGEKAGGDLAKVNVFETGTNLWRQYAAWPPPAAQPRTLYFRAKGELVWQAPGSFADHVDALTAAVNAAAAARAAGSASTAPAAVSSDPPPGSAFDEYFSDPAHPVPYLSYPATDVPQEYMAGDQRFAAKRPDVLTYQTPPLEEDLTVAGPVSPKLFVSTSGTDSDWIVKLIDVYPPDFPGKTGGAGDGGDGEGKGKRNDVPAPTSQPLAGYQQLVRGEPFRGKFRHGFEQPEPFEPGKAEALDFTMPDICHTFRRGHRIMVQVQSTWFPLVDRNPQTFVRIPEAKPEDFRPATQRLYHNPAQPSGIELSVLPAPER